MRLPHSTVMILVLFITNGCVVNYKSAYPLNESMRIEVEKNLAAGGILARPLGTEEGTPPSISTSGTQNLVEKSGVQNVSGDLSVEDLSLLLSSPTDLRMNHSELRSISHRVRHRYLIVGETASTPSWIHSYEDRRLPGAFQIPGWGYTSGRSGGSDQTKYP